MSGHVVRYRAAECRGAVPVGRVTVGVPAVTRGQAVVVADVALVDVRSRPRRSHLVIAGKWPRGGVVAPGSRRKRRGGRVAVRAIRGGKRRARRRVDGVIGGAVVGRMAISVPASRRSPEVVSTRG